MLNILGEADGEEGLQKAHEMMARAYLVGFWAGLANYVLLFIPPCAFCIQLNACKGEHNWDTQCCRWQGHLCIGMAKQRWPCKGR